MNKCLVTKLSGLSSNNELLRVGEMRVKLNKVESPSKETQALYIEVSKETTLEIIGDGYFTDETLSINNGKTKLVKSVFSNIFVSNSSVEIAVLNKYALIKIRGAKVNTFESNCKNKEFSLSNVKFSAGLTDINFPQSGVYGDLSDLQRLTTLQYVHLNSTQIYGDISSLKNLTGLSELNLSNTQIYGDIVNLKNLTGLIYINLSNTQIYGDISNLKNLTALRTVTFECKDTSLTGDIGSLKKLTNLVSITLKGASLTGDVATLSQTCKFISFEDNKNTVLTWSARPTTAKILAIAGNAKITNVDKMLQDQAKCQVGFSSNDAIWFKTISVVGTRTSASDDAVSTLQNKGYTVTVTPE